MEADFLHIPSAPVALAIFEWSGMLDQRLILSWTLINSPPARSTAIGTALGRGDRLLAEGGACWQATLDLTGDGTSNDEPQPREGVVREVTVNALVIGIGASVRLDHAETDQAGR
ncbi:DUF1194 domain-containing protein [Rhodovulum sulfidophilum]|uniref:DUF1194 domain-containing protein n=1 Tax=Rhodovulum sulfidophilum TaxID=35806 RepID=UPI0019212198|nr:DUF1194 domain-containing protein [Rhodovulum sulfidophilum]